jgi:hypothetical protein
VEAVRAATVSLEAEAMEAENSAVAVPEANSENQTILLTIKR